MKRSDDELQLDETQSPVSRKVENGLFAVFGFAILGMSLALILDDIAARHAVNDKSAVGGEEVYQAQRAAHLKRLRDASPATDPTVREREQAALDQQIRDLPKGEKVERIDGSAYVERNQK